MLAVSACAPQPDPADPASAAQAAVSTAQVPASSAPAEAGVGPSLGAPVVGISKPARLSVPGMGLDEPLIELGLGPDNTMEVPTDFDDVGWFSGGGRPGGIGPTVLAGHVDSTTGPAVFFRLGEVTVGETLTVSTADGTNARYRVTEIGDFAKAEFPTSRVFAATPRDEIRLITCAGVFDDSAGAYQRNLVVFGSRVS
ncbi:MAG: class F sortase [Rhodococcus sp. (in: high G+C Gram-positive bacteria)]